MKRNFSGKLKRAFARQEEAKEPLDAKDRLGGLRDTLQRHRERSDRGVEKVELPEGATIENERGACYLRTLRYPLSQQHGVRTLGAAFDADRERLAELAKDPRVVDLDLRDCLFLDTETTGLAGGAGTIVFMTGLGYFDADEFVVEQTFLRGFAEEPATLWHVRERLRERQHLVTFVGKSFDRHRLAARMAVHKVRSRVLSTRHLDLYHMARRVYKDRLPDCRLQTLEAHELGVQRADDLPGAMAPMAFLDWIRDGSGPVDRVFEHNRIDVLTLVALLAHLG